MLKAERPHFIANLDIGKITGSGERCQAPWLVIVIFIPSTSTHHFPCPARNNPRFQSPRYSRARGSTRAPLSQMIVCGSPTLFSAWVFLGQRKNILDLTWAMSQLPGPSRETGSQEPLYAVYILADLLSEEKGISPMLLVRKVWLRLLTTMRSFR